MAAAYTLKNLILEHTNKYLPRASPDLCSAKKIVKCPMRRKQLQKSRFVGAAILYHELLYAKRNAKRCIHLNTA